MKKYSTRILSQDDYSEVSRVICSRDYFSSISRQAELRNAREFHLSHTHNLLDADVQNAGLGRVFGATNSDGLLVGILVTTLSDCQANYYVVRAHTIPGLQDPSVVLSELMAAAIAYYEQNGYFRFYTVYTSSKIAAYQRLWKASESLAGYISYTEVDVGANEKVKQSEFWEKLYGRLLLPEPSAIRAFVRPRNSIINRLSESK